MSQSSRCTRRVTGNGFRGLNLVCERKGVLDSSEESAEWSEKTCLLYKRKLRFKPMSQLCV